jgi:rod shape-determining protein MreD
MNIYIKTLIRFCILTGLQVLLLFRINLLWWAVPSGFPPFSPHIYQLFILLLPFETPVWLLLLLGFFTGLTIDSFMNTAGIHAFATVLLAYLRTNVLSALLPRNLNEYSGMEPGIKVMGGVPFLTYMAFLLLVHHFAYYFMLNWSFANFGRVLLQVVASTLTSMLFVVSYVLLFTRQGAAKTL